MDWLPGLVLLIFCAGGVAALSRSVKRHKCAAAQSDSEWEPPRSETQEVARLPYLRRKYFFSAAERSFYEILRRLTIGYTVFAKVRLSDLVYVSRETSCRQSDFNRIHSKHIDFVICDRNLAPVLAIELDDSSHEQEHRQSRDHFLNKLFAAASFPLLRFRVRRAYVLDEIRKALLPYLPEINRPDCLVALEAKRPTDN